MGKFGKSLKRKKEVEQKKKVYDITEKIVKAEHKGRMIALANSKRLNTYLSLYYGNVIATTLKEFGWGYKKIIDFMHKYDYFVDNFLNTEEKWKCQVSWFKAGLYIECKGFRIDFKKEMQSPRDCYDFAEWCYKYIDHAIKKEVRKIQTVFYWTLHDKYGFGRVRLDRAKEKFQSLRGMSLNKFKAVCDDLNRLKPPKGEVNQLHPELAYEKVKSLTDRRVPDNEEMAYQTVNICLR
jgi:hypothetical protein